MMKLNKIIISKFIFLFIIGVSMQSIAISNLNEKAVELYKKKNLAEARLYWESFKESYKGTDGFWELQYGNLLNKYELPEEAATYLIDSAKYKKYQYYAYSYLVESFAKLNEFGSAESLGKKLISSQPNIFNAYYSLSYSYQIKGDYLKSIDIGLKGMEVENNGKLNYLLGESFYLLGDNASAIHYISIAIEMHPIYFDESWVQELLNE